MLFRKFLKEKKLGQKKRRPTTLFFSRQYYISQSKISATISDNAPSAWILPFDPNI